MTDIIETQVQEIENQPVITVEEVQPPAPVVAPEPPELVYEYQPMDELNRPLGGKQVIKYKTHDELVQKLTKQNVELVRMSRELKRKVRLGDIDQESIPEGVEKVKNVLQPRFLTPEERVQLSRDLVDPDKFDQATDTLFEAKVGANPQEIISRLTRIDALEAKAEAEAWVASTPGYYKCPENFQTMVNWLAKNQLAPVRNNFQYAYDTLKAAGLLLEAPIVREEAPVIVPVPAPVQEPILVNSQPVKEEPARISGDEPSQTQRPVSRPLASGLTRNQASDSGPIVNNLDETLIYEKIILDNKGKPTGQKIVYKGLAALDNMPGDEYGRRLKSNPKGFSQVIDALEATRIKR